MRSYFENLDWLCQKPIAHRALHNSRLGIIENSSSAVEAAMSQGYPIEVDVQPDKNYQPVVFHDATLDRLTNEQGSITSYTLDELRKIPLAGSFDTILSLKDLLTLVDGRVPIVVEIKSDFEDPKGFATKVGDILKPYNGPLAFMSFNPHQVIACAKRAPYVPRGLISAAFDDERSEEKYSSWQRYILRHLLMLPLAQPHFIAYHIHALPALAPLVAKNLFGLKLLTWTVRNIEEQLKAQKWADAIIFEAFDPHRS